MTGQPSDDQQTARTSKARSQGAAYQGAFEAVFAILIAAGLGLWADNHFGTSPRWLFVGTAIGFGSFVLRLVRLGQELQQAEDSDESSP